MSDAGLLSLVQWLSPAFPLGSFAYSHGLETAIAQGHVHDATTLQTWIETVLRHGAGRMDAALLRAAMDPSTDVDQLTAEALAMTASAERQSETQEQGAAFARTASALLGHDLQPMPLPIVFGVAARHLDQPAARVSALYLHAFASNLVSCAIRTVPLGQTDGHRVIAALASTCEAIGAETTHWAEIGSAAFGADLAAMQHETAEIRLYKT